MGELKDCGWKKAEEKKEAEVNHKDGDHVKKMMTVKKQMMMTGHRGRYQADLQPRGH